MDMGRGAGKHQNQDKRRRNRSGPEEVRLYQPERLNQAPVTLSALHHGDRCPRHQHFFPLEQSLSPSSGSVPQAPNPASQGRRPRSVREALSTAASHGKLPKHQGRHFQLDGSD